MKKSMVWDPKLFKDHYEKSTNNNIIRLNSEKRKLEFYMNAFALKGSEVVLDVGCGYGRLSKLIVNDVNKIIGIDINPENISYAKQYVGAKFEGHVVDLSLGVLPFPDKSIDKIVFDNVLMFFDDKVQAALFKESKRILKDGGVVAFNIENSNYFLIQVSNFFTFLYKLKAKIQGKVTPVHNKYPLSFYEKILPHLGFTGLTSIGDTFYRKMGVGVIEIFPGFLHTYIMKRDQKYYNTSQKNRMSSFTVAASLPKARI